jgi:hypothetical protein
VLTLIEARATRRASRGFDLVRGWHNPGRGPDPVDSGPQLSQSVAQMPFAVSQTPGHFGAAADAELAEDLG